MWQKMRLERFGGGSELWTALSAKQGARNLMLLGLVGCKGRKQCVGFCITALSLLVCKIVG